MTNRLTAKNDGEYSMEMEVNFKDYVNLNYSTDNEIGACIDKLGKLEDLEEKIGCPLEVRVKIFTGAKVYDSNGTEYEVQYVYENEFMATDGTCDDNGIDNEYHFLFNEYNQFWWLDNGDKSE